jgi:cytochrome c-type biogenesis protein CcmF
MNLCLYSILGSLIGIKISSKALLRSAKNASYCNLITLAFSVSCLVYAFVTRDFSIKYVFNHSSLSMNPIYTWVAMYAGNEGSLLYISLVISISSFLTLFFIPSELNEAEPYIISILSGFLLFFVTVMIFLANPFDTFQNIPQDGRGINPLLAHPGMFSHPPLLMAGLATIVAPFSLILGMIFTGKFRNDGLDYIRTTSLIVWSILGIGLLLGSWWAYTILGWGGYWAWDPIENVGLMPWLIMTAFIHSIIVQRRRGMFRAWNVILIFLAFVLAQFGMFINRGGPVVSVHSFAASTLGYIFLGFMLFSALFCLIIFILNSHKIKSDNNVKSFLSRESAFLMNNFFLVAITFVTLWGLIFPLISELFANETVTVGAPYYNSVNGPVLLALLFVMGVGPNLSWRNTSKENLISNLLIPISLLFISFILLLFFSARPIISSLSISVIVLVLSTILIEWIRGSYKLTKTGTSWYISFIKLIINNRKKYGGYIVHISILLVAIGVIGINFYQIKVDKVLSVGEEIKIGNYKIELIEINENEYNDRREKIATFLIKDSENKTINTMTGNNTFYPSFNMASIRAAINSNPIEDLYIIPSDFINESKMKLIVSINPLVWWMWIGGPVFVLGTLISLWPYKNRKG